MVDITFLATKRLAWRNSLTEEEQNALVTEKESWEAEETKGQRMGEFMQTFQAADTNND